MLCVLCRYQAAQEINDQVKEMSLDVKEIVDNLNRANSKENGEDVSRRKKKFYIYTHTHTFIY